MAALAAGGEAVDLKFSSTDNVYLIISLVFGLVAIVTGLAIRSKVLAQSKGSEKMQEVGGAIKAGALAYLRQQVRTMAIFVVLLAGGLFAMYFKSYGAALAVYVALSFVGGVAASYIAGYTGMLMAVESNMRTAHVALTSYKTSLETAFRSGAVAGLFTVGMGLIGATLIFLLAKGDAMKLLIGFGFGGSLAALFMRVGGGIFTKAADVGADLVGKVEAGIPEDDPRNPAVIADNVGDNVGDCAGMAADIFESYEVTLVAAIVLGAATAAIFDQDTWMKLIMFALMARGVGILASIVGVFLVKGSDDVDAEPLHAIRRGFYSSAAIAGVLSVALAWLMLGGMKPGDKVFTNSFTDATDVQRAQVEAIQAAAQEIAKEEGIEDWEVTTAQVKEKIDEKALGLNEQTLDQDIPRSIQTKIEDLPKGPDTEGFSRIDFSDTENPVLNQAAVKKPDPNAPTTRNEFTTIKDRYGKSEWAVYKVHFKQFQTPPAEEGQEAPKPVVSQEMDLFIGPMETTDKDAINQLHQPGVLELEVTDEYPAAMYANAEGDIALAIPGEHEVNLARLLGPENLQRGIMPVYYFKMSPEKVQEAYDKQQTDTTAVVPPPLQAVALDVDQKEAAWWKFAVCIIRSRPQALRR
jgi:K(+)-stimulated pyrophosphate-energized sodium pump